MTGSTAGSGDRRNQLSAANFRFLRDYIQRESGIQVGDDKLYLLVSRLIPLVDDENLTHLDDLCRRVQQAPAGPLRRKIVEAMTTHETLFFRDPAVYHALRDALLPELIEARRGLRTLRIWSAACSSGQEPYSLAMLLAEKRLEGWNLQILGTDLSEQILARSREGRYMQIEVNRGLPAPMLVKYFQRAGLEWQIKEPLRRMVRFQPFDLRGNIAALGPFDLVLCRNVMIYFDLPTRRQILGGIRRALHPGGYLLLGASETTFNIDESYQRKSVAGALAYQTPSTGQTL